MIPEALPYLLAYLAGAAVVMVAAGYRLEDVASDDRATSLLGAAIVALLWPVALLPWLGARIRAVRDRLRRPPPSRHIHGHISWAPRSVHVHEFGNNLEPSAPSFLRPAIEQVMEETARNIREMVRSGRFRDLG